MKFFIILNSDKDYQFSVRSHNNEFDDSDKKSANLNVEQNSSKDPKVINVSITAHIVSGLLEEITEKYHPQKEHNPCHYTNNKCQT